MRKEKDFLGEVLLPKDKFYGAQTQRSLNNLSVGSLIMPKDVIYAYACIKKAAAIANYKLKLLPKYKKDLIAKACDSILQGELDDHFPLGIFQTGSGTHTNMNVNEVISNYISYITKKKHILHPNDDINMSQSSNDTFQVAMHISAKLLIKNKFLVSLEKLKEQMLKKAKEFSNITKVGRTHFMDAVLMNMKDEFFAYHTLIDNAVDLLKDVLKSLSYISIGGTAIGNGVNADPTFGKTATLEINKLTKEKFVSARDKFALISFDSAILQASSALKYLACIFIKIANDLMFLSSGPRCGISELVLPVNEPGSSIMPGKVNPSQCESLKMVCMKVIGNDTSITYGVSQGFLQLSSNRPMIIYSLLESVNILNDSILNFTKNCLSGLSANKDQIKRHVENNLMIATELTKELGYAVVSKLVKLATEENISLKEAADKLGLFLDF